MEKEVKGMMESEGRRVWWWRGEEDGRPREARRWSLGCSAVCWRRRRKMKEREEERGVYI